jgi:Tol biopolymer transport system component
MKVFFITTIMLVSLSCFALAQEKALDSTEFAGEYLNQPKPGTKAVPFANGFFPKGIYSSINFSKDGSEAYWSSQASIYQSKQINGKWTKPEAISINSINGTCPVLSPDDKRLYFITWDDNGAKICFVERTSTGWSDTHFLPEIINSTPSIHWNIAVDLKGNIYFATGRTNTDVKILFSEYNNSEYTEPKVIENLKDAATICPYVAPDGSYLIFVKSELETHDKGLYIMFKKKDGGWTKETSITDIIGGRGFSPRVTSDGKYLFFFDKSTMYWADASFIEELRKKEIK